MPSELDRKVDAVLAAVTGPGGRIQIAQDARGRAIVANFPATLPSLFDAFCTLHGATEAVVADGERISFAELNATATRLARALAGGSSRSWGYCTVTAGFVIVRNVTPRPLISPLPGKSPFAIKTTP